MAFLLLFSASSVVGTSFNAAIPSVTLFSGKLSLHTVNEKALLPLLTFQLYSVISMCPCSTALSNNLDAVVAVSTSVDFHCAGGHVYCCDNNNGIAVRPEKV